MLDDVDLPGFDDLLDLLDGLWDALDLEGDELIDLEPPVVPLWPSNPVGADLASPGAIWHGLSAPPLDATGFAEEFGNMQFHNPFAVGVAPSPIETGSYDDLLVRTAVNTGIPLSDLPS